MNEESTAVVLQIAGYIYQPTVYMSLMVTLKYRSRSLLLFSLKCPSKRFFLLELLLRVCGHIGLSLVLQMYKKFQCKETWYMEITQRMGCVYHQCMDAMFRNVAIYVCVSMQTCSSHLWCVYCIISKGMK